jgi:hypothetical protein
MDYDYANVRQENSDILILYIFCALVVYIITAIFPSSYKTALNKTPTVKVWTLGHVSVWGCEK